MDPQGGFKKGPHFSSSFLLNSKLNSSLLQRRMTMTMSKCACLLMLSYTTSSSPRQLKFCTCSLLSVWPQLLMPRHTCMYVCLYMHYLHPASQPHAVVSRFTRCSCSGRLCEMETGTRVYWRSDLAPRGCRKSWTWIQVLYIYC